jgi:hypothetical protein
MLIVQKRIEAPMFGFRKWQSADYEKPIEFGLDGAKTRLYLVEDEFMKDKPKEVQIAMKLLFEIWSEDPPERILRSIKARGKATTEAAVWIHNFYAATMTKFEALLRVYGGIRNLHDYRDRGFNAFFSGGYSILDRNKVRWSTDKHHFEVFEPVLPKGSRQRHALFKGKIHAKKGFQ